MQEQTPVILMNFSGIYKEEEFWKSRQISWIEVQDICGTNCYCDEEAIAEIDKRTENYPAAGIHFIDSGNYHYMTRLWMAKIKEPFCLLVYDNHTDMQPPAFGGILSCGGWIAASLEELENLSRENLQGMTDAQINGFLEETVGRVCESLPLYISVDKDVLSTKDAQTTWSQGDMNLTTLMSGVHTVLECVKNAGGEIAGVDICGEADPEEIHENERNDCANKALLEVFTDRIE